MSLSSALQIGRSALTASSLGIATTSNNLANAATPGYRRQLTTLVPMRGAGSGIGRSVGMGVAVSDIRRQVNMSLEARTRSALSDENAAYARAGILTSIETTLGELGDNDLSSQLSSFFNAWSERANLVQSSAVVVQEGRSLAAFVGGLRKDLASQRSQVDQEIGTSISRANVLLDQIAAMNVSIAQAEGGTTTANTLRDQRDALVEELSTFVDVSVIERGGSVDVLIGSTPVVLEGVSRGLAIDRNIGPGGDSMPRLVTRDDGSQLAPTSGSLGALLSERTSSINRSIEALDTLTSQLIFNVNKLHSTGIGASWLKGTTGTLGVPLGDQSRALNDPANTTLATLPFAAQNGGFSVNVRNTATGAIDTIRIDIDLDGITDAGTPGTADDTSLEDIRAALDAIPGLSSTFTPDGRLKLDAQTGYEFTFSDDSSGALAVVGLNAYFKGTDARSIAINDPLEAAPDMLGIGSLSNGTLIENGTALALAGLATATIPALGNRSLQGAWRDHVTVVAAASSSASVQAQSSSVVRESLDSQRAAVSGVSVDEESINLLNYQRQYQAGARVIEVSRQLMDTLINLI